MTVSSDQIVNLQLCRLDSDRLIDDQPYLILQKPLSLEDGKSGYQLIIGTKKNYLFLLSWNAIITAAIAFFTMQIAFLPHFNALILFLILFGLFAVLILQGSIHMQTPIEHQFKTKQEFFEPITFVIAQNALWSIHQDYISRYQWQHFDKCEPNLNAVVLRTRNTVRYFLLGQSQLENA